MKDMKKEYNKIWWSSNVTSILLAIVGILLIVKPAEVITLISTVVGIGIIIAGIFAFLKYLRNGKEENSFKFDLIYGVICVVAGTLLIVNPEAVASILPLVIGVWMIINSIVKIQYALTIKQYQNDKYMTIMILSIITLAFGILLVFNPFRGAEIITQIIGTFITLYALLDIINAWILKKDVKVVSEVMEEAVKDVKSRVREDIPDADIEEVSQKKKKKGKKK